MKKIYFIWFLAVLLLFPHTYTMGAMTRGTVGEQGGQQHMGGGMMGGQQGQMDRGEMMLHGHEITGGMMVNLNQMTVLMQRMTDIMQRTTEPVQMKKMSVILGDMSEHLSGMSGMMKKDNIPQKEMEELLQHMSQTQKRFDMLMW